MKYIAIVYARHNSGRLPGKVLFNFGNQTVLGICVNKLSEIEGLRIIVATSNETSDDPIVAWCQKNNTKVFRGDLEDVALRTRNCLDENSCDAFFRINADSPYVQTDLIKEAMRIFETGSFDMVTNVLERTYPYGIAVELIKSELFCQKSLEFSVSEREHITSFFYKYPRDYKIFNIKNDVDLSTYRFVLDTPEDLEELTSLFKREPNIFKFNLLDLLKVKN